MSAVVRSGVSSSLLDLWEQVNHVGAAQRGPALAALMVGPDAASLPIGRRDALLLEFRIARRGPGLDAVVDCPECGEVVDFTLDAASLTRTPAAAVEPIAVGGYLVEWRPLDSTDLLAASAAADPVRAEEILVARCVTACRGPGGACRPADLPAEVRDALSEAMARVDPLAEVLVHLACPACGEVFVSEVDLVAFVWDEVRTGAMRLLRQVDLLARVYGWTEPEVLALSDERRAQYVALAAEAVR